MWNYIVVIFPLYHASHTTWQKKRVLSSYFIHYQSLDQQEKFEALVILCQLYCENKIVTLSSQRRGVGRRVRRTSRRRRSPGARAAPRSRPRALRPRAPRPRPRAPAPPDTSTPSGPSARISPGYSSAGYKILYIYIYLMKRYLLYSCFCDVGRGVPPSGTKGWSLWHISTFRRKKLLFLAFKNFLTNKY